MMICAGDLNTMANGVKRYQPWFCCDDLRWGSIGYSESEWFYKYGLNNGVEYVFLADLAEMLTCLGGATPPWARQPTTCWVVCFHRRR
jgi:hypothetical protein